MRTSPRPSIDTNWPSPEEIAQRAASIRAEWSPRQLRTRAGLSPDENSVEITLVSPGALDGRRGSIVEVG